MRVKCITNTNNDPQFNFKIGHEYIVYSMIMWGDSLDYLIIDESSNNPSWYPAELFKITNHLLPIIYYFTFKKYKNYKGEDSQIAIWGYKEMIENPDYYIAITEEKDEALKTFFKRKRQIDEYEEQYQSREIK